MYYYICYFRIMESYNLMMRNSNDEYSSDSDGDFESVSSKPDITIYIKKPVDNPEFVKYIVIMYHVYIFIYIYIYIYIYI